MTQVPNARLAAVSRTMTVRCFFEGWALITIAGLSRTTACGGAEGSQLVDGQDPASDATAIGETVPFSVYTHCGVENVRVDGRWWHAKPPLYGEDGHGPPVGWADPYQDGELTIESPDRVVVKAMGERVVFVPSPDSQTVRVCR
jgi:hypothetical protein